VGKACMFVGEGEDAGEDEGNQMEGVEEEMVYKPMKHCGQGHHFSC
jgi:hypothetical protein